MNFHGCSFITTHIIEPVLFQSHRILPSITMISSIGCRVLKHAARSGRLYSTTSRLEDRIVVAVGGNALQRRGERLTIENMLKAAAEMAPTIAELSQEHELVLTHGNGPQVGELALERSAATFDVLGAESMGQIGVSYCVEYLLCVRSMILTVALIILVVRLGASSRFCRM